MRIVRTIPEIRAVLEPESSIGLVPTMGAFHDGHLSLFAAARAECDVVVASLFVNPAQFGPTEDFQSYPRDEERDAELADEAGVDFLFAPPPDEMYPEGYDTWVDVGEVGRRLEGEFRPNHFRGVATVCLKLFNIVRPQRAYFGQKDAQAAVVKRVVADLNLDIEIRVLPTIRDKDGLALSTRNAYLSPEERETALALPRALATKDPALAREELRDLAVDYVEVAELDGQRVLAAAIRVEKTRLIDNVVPKGESEMSTPPKGKSRRPELGEMKRRREDRDGHRLRRARGALRGGRGHRHHPRRRYGGDGRARPRGDDRARDDGRDAVPHAHGRSRAARHPIVIGDMPFGSFQVSTRRRSRTRFASSRRPAPTRSSSRAPARRSRG